MKYAIENELEQYYSEYEAEAVARKARLIADEASPKEVESVDREILAAQTRRTDKVKRHNWPAGFPDEYREALDELLHVASDEIAPGCRTGKALKKLRKLTKGV